MRHLIIPVALLGGLVACSSSQPRVPPAESTTVAGLDMAVGAASRGWISKADDVRRFYRTYAERTIFTPETGAIVYKHVIDEGSPDPVIVPQLAVPLVLDEMGILEALRSLEE